MYSFLIPLAIFVVPSIHCMGHVPVVVWKSFGADDGDYPALKKWTSEEFSRFLEDQTAVKPLVVVFTEDHLNLEDFSRNPASFAELSTLTSQAPTRFFFPSVYEPISALHSIENNRYTWQTISVESDGDITAKEFNVAGNSVLTVKFTESRQVKDQSVIHKKHVSMISMIYRGLLKKNANVLALYTANRPTSLYSNDKHVIQRRTIHEEPTNRVFDSSDVLFYTHENNVTITCGGVDTPFYEFHENVTSVESADDNTTILYLGGFTLKLNITRLGGYWRVRGAELNLSDDKQQLCSISEHILNLPNYRIEAPMYFSYHCGQKMNFSSKSVTVSFNGLQIQPFTGGKYRFGDSFDCVNFFSVPILSGMFVTVIFAIIFAYGMCMIVDLKTNDMFDDAKGKTITVTATE